MGSNEAQKFFNDILVWSADSLLMNGFPSQKIQDLLQIKIPIIQAPMAGVDSLELALAVAEAGGLGSLACAMLNPDQIQTAYKQFQHKTNAPFNLNFFCHQMPTPNAEKENVWKKTLRPHYQKLGIDQHDIPSTPLRKSFDESSCQILEHIKPQVVSFHFGLPETSLLRRVKKLGTKVLATATSVEEALWLESQGCDAVIAQGYEAGGHRGTFLNLNPATQVGTFSLVPQIANTVKIPVIAAGGIANGPGIAAALMLGADAVQLGTAYLFCPEAHISDLYRTALKIAQAEDTVVTNIFSGRPARGILNRLVSSLGILSEQAPEFPLASTAIAPLRAKSEALGSTDYMQMWAGQSAKLCAELPAKDLTLKLAADALEHWKKRSQI